MQGGTIIPNDSNMDNYKTPGNYYIASNSGAQSLSNAPFANAFTLKVEYPTGIGGFVAQTFREFNTGLKAYRCSTSNASEWGGYYYFSDDATIFVGTAIQSGDDLNDYTTPGIYYSASQSVSLTLANTPETFQSGFAMFVFPMSANISQVIFLGGAGGVMYTRSTITSGFQKWYKFEGTKISS